jgi:hypothetical protein
MPSSSVSVPFTLADIRETERDRLSSLPVGCEAVSEPAVEWAVDEESTGDSIDGSSPWGTDNDTGSEGGSLFVVLAVPGTFRDMSTRAANITSRVFVARVPTSSAVNDVVGIGGRTILKGTVSCRSRVKKTA